jgi:hypothetical protein
LPSPIEEALLDRRLAVVDSLKQCFILLCVQTYAPESSHFSEHEENENALLNSDSASSHHTATFRDNNNNYNINNDKEPEPTANPADAASRKHATFSAAPQ